jgi:flagellar hook-length control protein FliK
MNFFTTMQGLSQGPESLYNAGLSARTPPQFESTDAPYVETFEQMMARSREASVANESLPAERNMAPDAGAADKPGTAEDRAELSGTADTKSASEKDRLAAEEPKKQETAPRSEVKETVKHAEDDAQLEEAASADMAALAEPDALAALADPAGEQSVAEALRENAPEALLRTDATVYADEETAVESGLVTATGQNNALSAEDGITLTDTHPLFENKPKAQSTGFEALVDDASAPDLAQEAEVWLADNKEAVHAVKGGAKDGLKSALPDSGGDRSEVPQPFQSDPNHQLAALTGTEKDAQTDPAAAKKKADTRKLNLDVADLRTTTATGTSTQGGTATETAKSAQIPVKDLTVDLKGDLLASLGDNRQSPASFDQFRSVDAKSAAQLESFLSRELHNNLNGDIVRQAQVMLRDGGEGLIRLQLHPESLGNVRIKLTMSGNRVDGTITVESPEALNAFEQELASLEMAFRDSGFEGASLNMQMSADHRDAPFDGAQAGAFSQVLAASSYDSAAAVQTAAPQSIYERGALSILA